MIFIENMYNSLALTNINKLPSSCHFPLDLKKWPNMRLIFIVEFLILTPKSKSEVKSF